MFFPQKMRCGFSLVEVMVVTAITGLVAVGMWQSLKYINAKTFRLSEQILLNEQIEQLEDVLELSLGRSLDSQTQYAGNCLVMLAQQAGDSSSQGTRVWRIGDPAFPNSLPGVNDTEVALFERNLPAGDFETVNCLSAPLTDSSWRNVSGSGQIERTNVGSSVRFLSGHPETTMPAGWEGNNLSTGNEYVTIEFWVKIADITNNGAGLIRYGHSTDDQKAIVIFVDAFGLLAAKVGGHLFLVAQPAIDDDRWHHVAVSYNRSFPNDPDDNSSFDIFIDGQRITGAAASINTADADVVVESRTLSTGYPLEIGEEIIAWGVRPDFVGDMDELRIWEEGDGTDASVRTDVANRIRRYQRESGIDTEEVGTLVARFSFDQDKQDSSGFVANAGGTDTRIDVASGVSLISGNQRSPAATPLFDIDFSRENRVVKANFIVSSNLGTETIGRTDSQTQVFRSSTQKPVAAIKPSGIIPIPEGGYGRLELTVEGARADFDLNEIEFEAVFDPGLAIPGNACDDLENSVTMNCEFSANSPQLNLTGSVCRRVLGAGPTDVECFIKSTGNLSSIDGLRFVTARIQSSDSYSSIPGDQFTFQLFEPCTAPDTENDNGDGSYSSNNDYRHWSILADVGTVIGGRFINQRSYVTYSWEGFHDGLMSDHFNSSRGTLSERYTKQGSINSSPDWQMWTRRDHISPVLFRQQDSSCSFEATPTSVSADSDDCKASPNGWYFIAALDRAGSRHKAGATQIQNVYKALFNKTTDTTVAKPVFGSNGRITGRRPNVYWMGDQGSTNEVSSTMKGTTNYSHGTSDVSVGAINHAQACERSHKTGGVLTRLTGGVGESLTEWCGSGFGSTEKCDGMNVRSLTGDSNQPAAKWCGASWEMSNMPVAPSGSYDQADDIPQKWPLWYDDTNDFDIGSGNGQYPPIGTLTATNLWRSGNVDGYAALMTTQNDPREYNNAETDPNKRNPTFLVYRERGAGNWLLQTSPMNATGTVGGVAYGPTSVPIEEDTNAMRFNLTTAIQCPYVAPTAPPPQ